MKKPIGIDLGTTFSAVATIDETGRPKILPNRHGQPITPSVIYFGDGQPLVGEEAKEMQGLGESRIASFFKRNMGDANFVLNFNGRDYTATDLSTIVLRQLKADAETVLGNPIEQAVITVPAYFNNFQREATIQAGRQAGLQVLRIINEPTAAALAYGLHKSAINQTVLVYDLGGGTFDVTLVHITASDIKVIATEGDHELGGKDWDDRIATYLGRRFLEEHGIDPLEDAVTFNDVLVRCETAKKQLSVKDKTTLTISHEGDKATYELSRRQFEELTQDLMERTQALTEQVLKEAGLKWKALEGVLLVGGSTRLPMVSRYVEQMSGKKPMTGVNVDEAVALGAAIQASMDAGESSRFSLAGKKTIQDVMSHSLGMVAENQDRSRYVNSIMIPKNKPIPCAETRPFQLRTTRSKPNQLEVYMLQGESEYPLQTVILGKYTFSGISHVPNQPAVLDIKYEYDRNGVVTVSALERSTAKTLRMQVEPVPADMSWLSRPPEKEQVVHLHLSVLIAIDLSGSMSGEPLQQAQAAAKRFITEMDLSHTSVGLLVFADSVRVTQSLSQNAKQLNTGIEEWTATMEARTVGRGNDAEPFSEALRLLKGLEDPRFLIVLTDGVWSYQDEAIRCAQQCHAEGIEIIAIGFGSADRTFLQAVATSEENALFTDLTTLVSSFSKIAQVLTESGGGVQMTADGKKNKGGLLSFFK